MELRRQLGHFLMQLGLDCFVVAMDGQDSSLSTLLGKFRVPFHGWDAGSSRSGLGVGWI